MMDKKDKCLTTCQGCALINKFPFQFCCLYECGEHEFCRGCSRINKSK